jgi:chromosome segregation ATPase
MMRRTLLLLGFLGLTSLVLADDKADHAAMKKEHAQAHTEHDAWQQQIGKHRVEHRRALAILREIESRILEHEASLEEIANHMAEHEDHISHHDEEIATHEKSGDDKDHAKLAESHKAVMVEHAAIKKSLDTFHDSHDQLIDGLTKLRALLPARK